LFYLFNPVNQQTFHIIQYGQTLLLQLYL